MTDDDKGNKLARVEGSWAMALEPGDWDQLERFAERICRLRIHGAKSIDDVCIRVMAGRVVGFSALQSLQMFDVINGMAAMRAIGVAALCKAHPTHEKLTLIESTATHATYLAKRKGEDPVTHTYTIEDARLAGLAGNANYKKQPAAMLRARCVSAIGRIVWPDALMGMYTVEELDAGSARIDDIVVTPMPPAVAAKAPEPPPSEVKPVDVREAEFEETDDPAHDLPPEPSPEEREQSFLGSIALVSTVPALESVYRNASDARLDKPIMDRIVRACIQRKAEIVGKKAG